MLPADGKQHISFDGIAAIDLKGKAIRELTTSGDDLWGIAGTVLDSETEQSRLWKVDLGALENGATITGVDFVYDSLPPRSEGLVVQEEARRAIVVIDGAKGDDSGSKCAQDAEQIMIKLP